MPIAALLLAATQAPAVPLTPGGPWVVQMEDDLCRLARSYPDARGDASVVFQPLLDLDTAELFVITDDRSARQYSGRHTTVLEPDGRSFTGRYYSVHDPKTKRRLTRLTIDRALLDQLKDGDALHVQARPVDLAFRITRPDKARTTLAGCIDGLKKSWGIDPAVTARAVTPLDGNPARYFGSSSYPQEALSRGIYGRVVALLNVAPSGTVEHCRIVSSAGTALNEGTCKVAMRIRFKPARDKNNQPLPSTYVLPVRWSMPGALD
jgi:TonB family protein